MPPYGTPQLDPSAGFISQPSFLQRAKSFGLNQWDKFQYGLSDINIQPIGYEGAVQAQAAAGLSSTLSTLIDVDYSDSPVLQSEDYAKATLNEGAQGAAMGAQVGGGIGAAVGFTIGTVAGLVSADKKREAMEKKWKADLKRYKDALKGKLSDVKAFKKKSKYNITKSTTSIAEATQKNIQQLVKMTQAQALGVTDVKGTQQIKDTQEDAEATIEGIYDLEMAKFSKLGELQAAIDSEISAGRGYGQIRTGNADRIQQLSLELSEGNYV